MKKIVLLVTLFFMISILVFAANWKYLSTDIRGNIYCVDRNSIHYYKGCADIWTKIIRRNGAWEICLIRVTTDKRLAVLSTTKYDRYGNVIYSRDYPCYTRRIVPDSMGEDLYIAIYYS